jgi:hypothetical protein
LAFSDRDRLLFSPCPQAEIESPGVRTLSSLAAQPAATEASPNRPGWYSNLLFILHLASKPMIAADVPLEFAMDKVGL